MIQKEDCQQATNCHLLVFGLLLLSFLALYIRTAAPSVLSGDSAEFQLVASTLGVAHPTTYPLYTMLAALATRILPFGDAAWRVTLVSSLCAAVAVSVFCVFVRRLSLSYRAALLSSLFLGVSPGLWNSATLAEVYTLLILLLCLLALALLQGRLYLAAFIAGLGFSHHGLFVITALPICAAWIAMHTSMIYHTSKQTLLARIFGILLCFALGLVPWFYPFIQYARYGPFNGLDYGLPRHYFWGAPSSWVQVADLVSGGTLRRGIFRLPTLTDIHMTFSMLAERALFEFGWPGLGLGIVGSIVLLGHKPRLWFATAWVLFATIVYLLLLGPAVADAPTFTMPMLLPWALYIAYGLDWLIDSSASLAGLYGKPATLPQAVQPAPARVKAAPLQRQHTLGMLMFALLCIIALWWANTRFPYANKRHLWLYREFGQASLTQMAPKAVVLAHWEQGMTLQYLHLVEGQRPDVWVDVVEPGDDAWAARIQRRYAGRAVYLIGSLDDVAGLPVELVYEDKYARMFRLIEP